MTFGFQCDEDTSRAILDAAFEAGITFIDTADAYPLGSDAYGTTEEIIGRWMTGRRDNVVLATKCFYPTGPNPWDRGNSRQNTLRACDASLRRLRTDHIDLYQLHAWDVHTPIDETLGALDDLVRAGKVRYAGCSNFAAYQLARSIGRSEVLGAARFDCAQPRYNLIFREFERDLLPLCGEEGIGVIPYNPLAGGLLTGKHRTATAPTDGSRFTLGSAGAMYSERYWHDRQFATIESLAAIATAADMTMAEMAVSWVLAHPAITSPIVGASRPEQLADAVRAEAAGPMDAGLKQRLDDLTAEYRTGDAGR